MAQAFLNKMNKKSSRKEELKAINSEGFTSAKNITNFIGENYKTNELYFDTALNNELSFLKSSLYGYKLELLERRKGKELKNSYGNDIQLWQKTFIKIPKVLYDEENVKFIFVEENNYKLLDDTNINLFIQEKDYIIYDLCNWDYSYLKEIEKINHKKASIIILSSQVELKYEFTYDYRELEYLDVLGFEQVSFIPKDTKNLEQYKKKEKSNEN